MSQSLYESQMPASSSSAAVGSGWVPKVEHTGGRNSFSQRLRLGSCIVKHPTKTLKIHISHIIQVSTAT